MPTDSDVPLEKITELDSRHPRRSSSSDALLSPTAALDPVDLRRGYVLAGRYEVIRKLGQGGFGTVFLARDSKLERDVAIKRHRGMDKKDVELLRTEAKRIASMDHPSIVSVYDLVDDVNDGLLIVMQFINGRTLSEHLRERRPSTRYLFSVLEQVCKGLAHAHARNLVHRDIKPSNILLGADSRAYLSDFGLAILRADTLESSICGTPGYMAPEQVRGESHRIDRRTDIWAMGTLLYEIFVGTLPFKGLSKREILERTIREEPLSPRQIAPNISQDLERIILRCLRKRMSERYSSVEDLLDELSACPEYSDGKGAVHEVEPVWVSPSSAGSSPSGSHSTAVPYLVPKGFRSFDAEDANYFLHLVPGPRDRFGVPDSIRFWKSWAENEELSRGSPVGVLYGPSGSGKSSFIRAGLCPRLDAHIAVVPIDCQPGNLIDRLIASVSKACSMQQGTLRLSQILSRIRHDESRPTGYRKVLLVLDQFESWSHSASVEQRRELAEALRQCDGLNVQALISVRDDFWMGITELMGWLDLPLVEGKNCASIELLDRRLAERILEAMGRAYGALPQLPSPLETKHDDFIKAAVEELAMDERVICVHLTMFANMMRLQQWSPEVLKQQGGVQGACVRYLNEIFDSRNSPPNYRRISKSVVDVLEFLLPSTHEEVRTRSCTKEEIESLLSVDSRQRMAEETLRVLSDELRLITPVGDEDSIDGTLSSSRKYQLAHDFLIAPIRDWIEPIRKSTWQGRALARLKELSELWTRKPTKQFYPTVAEWIAMRASTRTIQPSEMQKKYLRAASRYHAGRVSAVALSLALATVLGIFAWQQSRAASTSNKQRLLAEMDLLLRGNVDVVPRLVEQLSSSYSPKIFEDWRDLREFEPLERWRLLRTKVHRKVENGLLEDLAQADVRLFDVYVSILQQATDGPESLQKLAENKELNVLSVRSAVLLSYMGNSDRLKEMMELADDPEVERTLLEIVLQWKGDSSHWISWLADDQSNQLRYVAGEILGGYPKVDDNPTIRAAIDELPRSDDPMLSSVGLWFGIRHFGWTTDEALGKVNVGPRRLKSASGVDLIRVDAGSAEANPNRSELNQLHELTIPEPLWVSMLPISNKQIAEFADSTRTHSDGTAIEGLDDEDKPWNQGQAEYPAMKMKLGILAEFCNHLSQAEGLGACYEYKGIKKNLDYLGNESFVPSFDLVTDADGYRLLRPEEFGYLVAEGRKIARNWKKASLIEQSITGSAMSQNETRKLGWLFPSRLGIFHQDDQRNYFTFDGGELGVDVYSTPNGFGGTLCVPALPNDNQVAFLCRRANP